MATKLSEGGQTNKVMNCTTPIPESVDRKFKDLPLTPFRRSLGVMGHNVSKPGQPRLEIITTAPWGVLKSHTASSNQINS